MINIEALHARLRSAGSPPSFDHLHDPGLVQRLSAVISDPGDVVGDDGEPVKRRQRRPSLASVAKQAEKAGITVASYDVRPDGTISVVVGADDPKDDGWRDVVLQ